MNQASVARATLGRLPLYLQYLKSLSRDGNPTVSATTIAKALGLGEVQVRKDLSSVSGEGKPKIGYVTAELIDKLESFLRLNDKSRAVIVGVGRLGKALLGYEGFADYGLEIVAAFDCDSEIIGGSVSDKTILPAEQFEAFCQRENVKIGIITVPEDDAQDICDRMVKCGIRAIWNFATRTLTVPEGVQLRQENLALSLAYLNTQTGV